MRVIGIQRKDASFGRFGGECSTKQPVSILGDLATLLRQCRESGTGLSVIMLEPKPSRLATSAAMPDRDSLNTWFSDLLLSLMRQQDRASHIFRDRFAVALPGYSEEEAYAFTERCRRTVQLANRTGRGIACPLQIAAGIAKTSPDAIKNGYQLLQHARIALHHARKQHGDATEVWRSDGVLIRTTSPERQSVANGRAPITPPTSERWPHHCESTEALIAAVDAKDPYTRCHSQSVADFSVAIGKRMRLTEETIRTLRSAALLHDIGKIGVPDAILSKPGPLTDEEYEIVKRHPQTAIDILKSVNGLSEERPLILHHHERFDGTGYPAGLKGDEIPLGARILSVADALDTMLSPRAYKEPFSIDRTREELANRSGGQFDPDVVTETLRLLEDGIGRVIQPDLCHC